MEPSDSKQTMEEIVPLLAAHYRSAIDLTMEDNGGTPLSINTVHKHMIERAKQYSMVMGILSLV